MALMGTSSRFVPSRRNRPTTSDTPTTAPRLHQVSPTSSATPTASSTPASTLAMRPTPLLSVCDIVSCTTSRAVSGASTGAALVPSCCAMTKDSTAAAVVLAVRKPGTRPRRKRWRTPRLTAGHHAVGSARPCSARDDAGRPRFRAQPSRPLLVLLYLRLAYPGRGPRIALLATRSSCWIRPDPRPRARGGAPRAEPGKGVVASPATSAEGVGETLPRGPRATAGWHARLASAPGRAADRR